VLLSDEGRVLGTLAELDTSSGNSLSTAGEVWSTCLHFNGTYTDTAGRPATLAVGTSYKLRTQLTGLLPLADAALGRSPVTSEVRSGRGGGTSRPRLTAIDARAERHHAAPHADAVMLCACVHAG
jgi:hypothetical protein